MSDNKQEVEVKAGSDEKKELQKRQTTFGEMERTFDDFFQHRFNSMERLFDDLFQRRIFAPSWMPRLKFSELSDVSATVDMFEDGNDLVIKAEIPGMKKDEISVDIADDIITISGEKKSEERTERNDYYHVERSFGSFSRKLRLPVEIQSDKVKASFKDGVLEIRMPKSEAAKKNTKKIAVE